MTSASFLKALTRNSSEMLKVANSKAGLDNYFYSERQYGCLRSLEDKNKFRICASYFLNFLYLFASFSVLFCCKVSLELGIISTLNCLSLNHTRREPEN